MTSRHLAGRFWQHVVLAALCVGCVMAVRPAAAQDGASNTDEEASEAEETEVEDPGFDPVRVPERCEKLGEDQCPRFLITRIDVEGLNWTQPYVVDRELIVAEGQTASYAEVVESVKRIRNTHIFRKVEYALVPTGPDRDSDARPVTLKLEVDERWTLRPVFSFSQGGGTQRLIVGVLDINFLGRYLGLGARYERFGPTNSFLFWAYDPRFLGERLQVGVNGGTSNRTYTLYDESGQIEGGFLMRRFDAGAYVSREWKWWLSTYFGMSYQVDSMSLDFISDDIAAMQRDAGVPPDTRALFFEVGGSVGRLNEDNYNYDGQVLSVGMDIANSALGSTDDVIRFGISGQFFRELPLKSNLGLRAATGFADSEVVQHKYFLGGLDAIRGFTHDLFRGEQYWLAGAEYRIPSFDYRWFVLQHVAFIDVAHVSRDMSDYFGLSGASAGIGVRIIIPKIDGFNARIDYAFPLYGNAASPLSFGGGQFF